MPKQGLNGWPERRSLPVDTSTNRHSQIRYRKRRDQRAAALRWRNLSWVHSLGHVGMTVEVWGRVRADAKS